MFGKKFSCPKCNMKFKTEEDLMAHKKTHM
jgi:uncharacterized C2H2 Zn-finger protein